MIALLAINWLSVLLAQPGSQPRVNVPFNPYFLQQLDHGHVKSITSKSNTIQGTWTVALRYPANDTGQKKDRSGIFSYYNKQVEIHGSARKHGVADQDIVQAIDYALAIEDAGEDPDRYAIRAFRHRSGDRKPGGRSRGRLRRRDADRPT